MGIAATGFKISTGADLNAVVWGYTGEVRRDLTESNNCAFNCNCRCDYNCNCNCSPAALALNVYLSDYRIDAFRNTAYNDGIRPEVQDGTPSLGLTRYYRTNCNCNCNCNCQCACNCNCK